MSQIFFYPCIIQAHNDYVQVCADVCVLVQSTLGKMLVQSSPGHRGCLNLHRLRTGSFVSVHPECQLHEDPDFCLFCMLLRPSI